MHKKGLIGTIVVIAMALIITGLVVTYFMMHEYRLRHPRPSDKFIISCGWDGMVRGVCDKKGNFSPITKEDLEWIMRTENVSSDKIIEYAKQYITYRKDQISKYDNQKDVPKSYYQQIKHLEEIIATLEEK